MRVDEPGHDRARPRRRSAAASGGAAARTVSSPPTPVMRSPTIATPPVNDASPERAVNTRPLSTTRPGMRSFSHLRRWERPLFRLAPRSRCRRPGGGAPAKRAAASGRKGGRACVAGHRSPRFSRPSRSWPVPRPGRSGHRGLCPRPRPHRQPGRSAASATRQPVPRGARPLIGALQSAATGGRDADLRLVRRRLSGGPARGLARAVHGAHRRPVPGGRGLLERDDQGAGRSQAT